jgi:DNA-binding CsgD family transcriptional regulator
MSFFVRTFVLKKDKQIQPMKAESISQQETKWSISKQMEKTLSKEFLEELLFMLNQLNGANFYIMDYHKQRIIVDSPSSLILCGYPKELVEQEGFDFFKRILNTEECTWIAQANNASYSVFFDTHLKNRKKLLLFYDLIFNTADKREIILHHRVVPYQLCKNGNLWMSLCSTTLSNQKKSRRAFLFNTKTGDRYQFDHSRFVHSDGFLSEKELKILKWLAKGLTAEKMSLLLNVSIVTIKRKKKGLYKKLGVSTALEAVHRASVAGYI